MSLHVVDLASVQPQPWRNGGGVTRELLAWPPGSGGGWLVRVSVADIERDGPFSAFPGVQRWFTVLEGAGVVLGFAGHEQALTTTSAPLGFDGAAAPACRLIGGATRDLNLMVRHEAGRARMLPAMPGEPAPAPARWQGLYTATAAVLVTPTGPLPLPSGSLVWSDAPQAAWRLEAALGAPAPRGWWMLLQAHA